MSQSSVMEEGGKLNQSLVNKHFVSIDEWRQNSSANRLQGEEWEFGGAAPGLIMSKQSGVSMSLI